MRGLRRGLKREAGQGGGGLRRLHALSCEVVGGATVFQCQKFCDRRLLLLIHYCRHRAGIFLARRRWSKSILLNAFEGRLGQHHAGCHEHGGDLLLLLLGNRLTGECPWSRWALIWSVNIQEKNVRIRT